MHHRRSATKFFLRHGFVVVGVALSLTLCHGADEKRETLSVLHQAWQTARRIDDPRERALALHRVAQAYAQLERLEEARAAFYEALTTAINEEAVYAQGQLLRTLLTSSIVAKLCPEIHPQADITSPRYPFGVVGSPDALLAAVAETARESIRCAPVAPADLCALLARFREPDWYVEASLSKPSLRLYRPQILLNAAEVRLQRGDHETARRLLKRCFYELVPLQLPHILPYDVLYNHLCGVQAQGGWYDDAYLTYAWLYPPWREDRDYFSFLAGKLIQNSQFDAAYQVALLIPETEPAVRASRLHELIQRWAQDSFDQPCKLSTELKPIFLQALKDALIAEGGVSLYSRIGILTTVLASQRHFLTPQEALDNLRTIELNPPSVAPPECMFQIYYAIGLALLEMGRVEEAEPYLILALVEPRNYQNENLASVLILLSGDNPTAQWLRVVYESFAMQESERRRQQREPRGGSSQSASDSSEKLSQKELGQSVPTEVQQHWSERQLFEDAVRLSFAFRPSPYPPPHSRGELLGQLESLYGVTLQMSPSPRRAELLLHIAQAYTNAGLQERAAACLDLSVPDLILWKQENWEAIVRQVIQKISYDAYLPRSSLSCLPNPFLHGSTAEVTLVEYLLESALLYADANRSEEGRWILQHASEVIFLWGGLGEGAGWLPRLYQVSKQLGDESMNDQILRRAFHSESTRWMGGYTTLFWLRALLERGDFDHARLLAQRLAQTPLRVEALATLAEGYRAAGQLQQARALIAQAIDEAQGFAPAWIVDEVWNSSPLQIPALWLEIGLRLTRLDEATLKRQRRATRHPLVQRGIDALLTRSAQHREQLLREARSPESPIRRAWLLTLIGVGSKRMGDAATAAQAFSEAANAVRELVYPHAQASLRVLLMLAHLGQTPSPPRTPSHNAPQPLSTLLYPELEPLLETGDYLEAFRVAAHSMGASRSLPLYNLTDVVSAHFAQDPRRLFLLPAIYRSLSESEYLSVALALIESGDYRNALQMALNTLNERIQLEIVMRTALAQAQRGQRVIALATLELLDSLLVNPKRYEFEKNDFIHQIYLTLGDAEKAEACLQTMRRLIEWELKLEHEFQDDLYYCDRFFRFVEALARTGNHDAARRWLLRRTPMFRETLIEIAAVQAHWGYWGDALATLETLVRGIAYESSPTPKFQVQLAEVLFMLLRSPYRDAAMRFVSPIVYAWRNYAHFSDWIITRCLLQGDHDMARLLANQFPAVPEPLPVVPGRLSHRADALTRLAAYWARIRAESEWRSLYNELMRVYGANSRHSRALYEALTHHGWRREAATLLACNPSLPTTPLVEAGEYDLLLNQVAPLVVDRRQLSRLAAQLTRTLGSEETLRCLRELDSPIYQFEWLMGIVEAKLPPRNPSYLSPSREE